MPPRLSHLGALRNSSPFTLLSRPLSSTAALAAPPRDASLHHHQPRPKQNPASSSDSLLSIHKNDRPARSGNSSSSTAADGSNDDDSSSNAASRLLNRYKDRADAAARNRQAQIDFLRHRKMSNDYLRQMPRRWDAGDVYSPHDMSPVEMQKWRKRSPRKADVVDALGIRPLDMYKNFSLAQEFTTSSGQISHSSMTGLRPVNQRKIAKMIRRVQGMGLYPTIHDHPEMIRDDFFPTRR